MKILRVYFKAFNKIGNFNEAAWLPDASGTCRGVAARKVPEGVELVAEDEVCVVPWGEIARLYYKNEPAPTATAEKSRRA